MRMGQFLCRVADADGRVFFRTSNPRVRWMKRARKLVDRGLYVFPWNPGVVVWPI